MTELDVQRALAAIAEPTRFRIVGLLAERACTVSEVQEAIGARQPQTTKHVQALEVAEVIRVHRLGRRRVAQLDRDTMARLGEHFASLTAPAADDAVIEDYARAIRAEETGDGTRTLTFDRVLPASVARAWEAWTTPDIAARWWAPRHFEVEEFTLTPATGAPIRLTLRESGARYTSEGRVQVAEAPSRLVFTLAPTDDTGEPLFEAMHTLTLTGDDRAELSLRIEVSEVRAGAASAVAGLEPGWNQLLDALEAVLAE